MNIDLTFRKKTVPVERFGTKIRSNLHRSIARNVKALDWRGYHGTRRPRRDDEIAVAWLRRVLWRDGVIPIYGFEKLSYEPDPRGPGATWFVTVRALIPTNEHEAMLFDGLRIPDWTTFNFMEEVQ